MAMAAAGFSGGQAEELRRAMGFKRSSERMREIEKDLRAGMARKRIAPAAQEEIVTGIKSFALYGFPESHAASFALIAYASAFLKAHHPAAFLCALLNNQPMGFYHPATLIRDAAQHGVRTLPVDVQRSEWECGLERTTGAKTAPLAVRLGLKYVRGLREDVARVLVSQRRSQPFASLVDFRARVQASADLCATLAEIGAFSSLGVAGRREVLWQVEALGRSGKLFVRVSPEPGAETSCLPEASPQEEMLSDLRATSVTTGPHPLAFLRPMLAEQGIISAQELAEKADGERVRVAGVVVVRQRPATAKGIVFVTLEDETGFANAIVMPEVFSRWRQVILGHPALVIEGRVQKRDNVVIMKPESFAALPGRPVNSGWARDFH